KHGGARRLGPFLGALMAARVSAWGFVPDAVTHVPTSARRRAERGFDQAAVLAAALADRLGRRHLSLLTRAPTSRSQQRLSRASRAANVGGACAAALAAAGAREVRVAVVARTVRGDAPPAGPW